MDSTTYIFAIAVTLLFITCGQAVERKTVAAKQDDTPKTLEITKEDEISEKRKLIAEQEKIDSLNDVKVLREAIGIAEKHKVQDKFEKSYVATTPDNSYQVEVEISCGFYFSNDFPHLIIKRTTPGSVYIDIFSKTDKQFQKVLSHQQWKLEYIGDTIRDINGDGLKDFVVKWYGSTGCCLKAFSNIYLQRADKKTFSNTFKFINPTFSPKEQVIRGVCYGHPGETELYKYKWNSEKVDTLEYVYYEKNAKGKKTGKLIVSNNRPFRDNHKILKRLSYMPAEYKTIEGCDWFEDNFDRNANR